MSAKRFNALDLIANVPMLLMTGKTGYDSTAVVRFVNRAAFPVQVSLSYSSSQVNVSNIPDSDYMIFNHTIEIGDFFEIKGIAIEEKTKLFAVSNYDNVNVIVYGFEELK